MSNLVPSFLGFNYYIYLVHLTLKGFDNNLIFKTNPHYIFYRMKLTIMTNFKFLKYTNQN